MDQSKNDTSSKMHTQLYAPLTGIRVGIMVEATAVSTAFMLRNSDGRIKFFQTHENAQKVIDTWQRRQG